MNTNRLSNKSSKEKNRPKSTVGMKKIVDTHIDEPTPDEPPEKLRSLSLLEEETIKALKIDQNKLISKHVPSPPPQKPKSTVKVRKTIPASKCHSFKAKKKVMVAYPVDETKVKEIEAVLPASSIANLTDQDTLKEHHILGTLQDFREEASKRGFPLSYGIDTTSAENEFEDCETPQPESPSGQLNMDETNALQNWERQMLNRKRQQEYLAKHMSVEVQNLVMNQSEAFRSVQEERELINKAMPSKDYGKGYRVGSEFWKQVETVGDDGVSITLNQTEKGNAPAIEHIGHANYVKNEMGHIWRGGTARMTNIHYPWWKSPYLKERKEHLQDVMQELDPHQPFFENLEVIGRTIPVDSNRALENDSMKQSDEMIMYDDGDDDDNDDENEDDAWDSEDEDNEEDSDILDGYPDVVPQPIFGPSLLINGQTARWEGSKLPDNDHIGMTLRLQFETETGNRCQNNISITNDGTTAMRYHWKRIPKDNVFQMQAIRPINRFYFEIDDGIILPNVTINIPFFFKSPNSGIFMETWQLETNPSLMAGAAIQVVLRGVATKDDDQKEQRKALDILLEKRQSKQMVKRIVDELLLSIKTPPRPSTPMEIYITEEDIFTEKNQKTVYKNDIVNGLKEFYDELHSEQQWDLSLDTLMKNTLSYEENEEGEREGKLEKLNTELKNLEKATLPPIKKTDYDVCYQIMCETIDSISSNAVKLQTTYEIAEKPFTVKVEIDAKAKPKKGIKDMVDAKGKDPRSESRGKKDSPVARTKTPGKDKTRPPQAVELTSSTPPATESQLTPPPDPNDPSYLKYIEMFYMQTYASLVEMVDNFDAVLSSTV